jgi:hypothetical protein
MPKQHDGYNIIELVKHMISLNININLLLTFMSVVIYPHRNFKFKAFCSFFCDKGSTDHLCGMGVII